MKNATAAATRVRKLRKNERDGLKAALSEQLRVAMAERGWNPGKLADEASKHLRGERKITHSHIWHYVNQRSLPRPDVLDALTKALGTNVVTVREEKTEPRSGDVVPAKANATSASTNIADLHIQDLGDGYAWVQFSQRVRWEFVIHIIKELHRTDFSSPEV